MTPYELRYRDPSVKQPTDILTNKFTETVLKRKSVRVFDSSRKLPKGQLEYLIAVAQSSPTSSGGQSWSVIALTTDEEKEAFRSSAGYAFDGTDANNLESFNTCSAFLIWVADNYKIAHGIDIVSKKEAEEATDIFTKSLVDNPQISKDCFGTLDPLPNNNTELFSSGKHIAWLDQSNYSIRAIIDATIAAQTFSLAAESIGLGTLYIGSVPHCKVSCFKEVLGLPEKTFPVFGMCIGYEPESGTDQDGFVRKDKNVAEWFKKNQHETIKPRHPQNIVLHRGQYNKDVRESLKQYNKIAHKYYMTLNRVSDYLVKKCVLRVKKTTDILTIMRHLGNMWK